MLSQPYSFGIKFYPRSIYLVSTYCVEGSSLVFCGEYKDISPTHRWELDMSAYISNSRR